MDYKVDYYAHVGTMPPHFLVKQGNHIIARCNDVGDATLVARAINEATGKLGAEIAAKLYEKQDLLNVFRFPAACPQSPLVIFQVFRQGLSEVLRSFAVAYQTISDKTISHRHGDF